MEPKTNAQVALESAVEFHGRKGSTYSTDSVIRTSERFLEWLDNHS